MSELRKAAQGVVKTWRMYGTAKSLRGWMEILEAALAAEQAQPVQWKVVTWDSSTTRTFLTKPEAQDYLTMNADSDDWHIEPVYADAPPPAPVAQPVAWMAMRWGVPAQATTDEPTAIRWRKAGGDVRPLIYADAPPPAPVAQPAAQQSSLSDLAESLRDIFEAGGSNADIIDAIDKRVQPAAQQTQGEAMTPERAAFLLRRFKHDERMLGPVEQAAIDYALGAITAQQTAVPLTDEEIDYIDQSTHFHETPGWPLRFARAIERAHGIGKESGDGR